MFCIRVSDNTLIWLCANCSACRKVELPKAFGETCVMPLCSKDIPRSLAKAKASGGTTVRRLCANDSDPRKLIGRSVGNTAMALYERSRTSSVVMLLIYATFVAM